MKAVRWQVPFETLNQTRYRIDIYDEGYTGQPVQLIAGATPFTTREDNAEDLFTPVRSQTAVLSLIDTDGTLMADLIPEDNTSRPVRLIEIQGDEVVWQGFLSCEAYTQQYTDRPNAVSINCNSVLAAMDSVELPVSKDMLFQTQIAHLVWAMHAISDKAGLGLFNDLYISYNSSVYDYIYINSYFEAREVVSGECTEYDIHSISCKKMLERIAKFYGLVFRERGRNLFLTLPDRPDEGRVLPYLALYNNLKNKRNDPIAVRTFTTQETPFDGLQWRGADHQVSYRQGARRVLLKAKVEPWKMQIKVPECPYSWLTDNPQNNWATYGELHLNNNATFNSACDFRCHSITFRVQEENGAKTYYLDYNNRYNAANYYQQSIFWYSNNWVSKDFVTYYKQLISPAGNKKGTVSFFPSSFLTFYRDDKNEIQEGLCLYGFPISLRYGDQQYDKFNKFALSPDNYIFRQECPLPFSAGKGWFRIETALVMASYLSGYHGYIGTVATPVVNQITAAVQFGEKWWNGTEWSSSFATFVISFDRQGAIISNKTEDMKVKTGDGLYLPITERNTGVVRLYLYHEIGAWTPSLDPAMALVLRPFLMEYVSEDEELRSNRTENGYIRNLPRNFANEVTYDIDLVTDAYNDPSANMIYDAEGETIKYTDDPNGNQRTELKTLDRLEAYYQDSKRIISVEAADTIAQPSLTQVAMADGKKFAPLAIEKDYRTEKSTITLFELP